MTSQAPTRAQGYALSRGKEQGGIDLAMSFFTDCIGTAMRVINDAEENYRLGDLRSPTGWTVEVKRQPIDPAHYRANFVEVFEQTGNPRHAGGMHDLARLLDMPRDALSLVPVTDRRVQGRLRGPLGVIEHMSLSVTSIARAELTCYANPDNGHLYVYGPGELIAHVRTALRRGLARGAGRSNEDTFSVLVPLSFHRWQLTDRWRYLGAGTDERARDFLFQGLASPW